MTYLVAFNTKRGPLADRELRRAWSRRWTCRRSSVRPRTAGHSGPGPHPAGAARTCRRIGPRAGGLAPGAATRPPGEIELTASVNPLFFDSLAALADELWRAWAKLGVKVRVVNRTIDEMAEAAKKGSVDLDLGRWIADYPDPDTFACQLHSEWGFLGRMCTAPEVDRLVERARVETEPAVRHALYREVEEIIARESLLIPLFHEQAYRFARPEVEGLSVAFGIPTVAYEKLRLRE